MLTDKECPQHALPILLLCLNDKCSERLLCLRCTDQHKKHELVSQTSFVEMMGELETNRNNPDRLAILDSLNSSKD